MLVVNTPVSNACNINVGNNNRVGGLRSSLKFSIRTIILIYLGVSRYVNLCKTSLAS